MSWKILSFFKIFIRFFFKYGEKLLQQHHVQCFTKTSWPYRSQLEMQQALVEDERREDQLVFVICEPLEGSALGTASYLRAAPEHGVIEIGAIWFGPALRRRTAASEAIYLLLAYAFGELGYRRVEWKCNALNAASRRAAQRFGWRYEGIFEQHQVVKGRNRDTAWYAITDARWPAVRDAFERWLRRRTSTTRVASAPRSACAADPHTPPRHAPIEQRVREGQRETSS